MTPSASPPVPAPKLTILVPSRNRAEMARRTIESLRAQDVPGVSIVVSDNSTDEREREQLAAACAELDDVHYLSPPGDLAMTDHWTWAFGRLRDDFSAPLVSMVTDRMVMRPGALAGLLELAAAHPERLVSYNHDAVEDRTTPVRLRLEDRSGRAFELSAEHLLQRCAHVYFHACIPRVMNCIVPQTVLDAVEQRYGSLFASISPDHCFGFRCLDVVDAIVYYDACPLIHYALARSNGASYASGVSSADADDFQRHLGAVQMNASAPVPAFHSITNAVVNEYCFVRAEPPSRKLPALDPTRYLGAMARETARLEDPELRERMRRLLDEQGWSRIRPRYRRARTRDVLELLLRRPRPFLRLLRLTLAERLPPALAALLGAGERRRTFATTEQALAHLMSAATPTAPTHVHLLPLLFPRGRTKGAGATSLSFRRRRGRSSPLPHPPGSISGLPQLLEVVAVAQRVHRLPEPLVTVGGELTLPCERAHRLLLPHGVITIEVATDPWRKHEKTTIGPAAVPPRFLLELPHPLAIDIERPEPTWRLHRGHGRVGALVAVKRDESRHVHIRDAVAVGEAEVLVANIRQDTLQAPPGHRLLAGVHQRHPPRLGLRAMDLHVALRQVEGDVARVQVVVGEVLLDQVALVAEADHELLDPMGGVDLHDVPEHRLAADLDHWLGTHSGLLAESRAETAGQDHGLHGDAGYWTYHMSSPVTSRTPERVDSLSGEEMGGLMAVCDCYVSLHPPRASV